MKISFVSRAVLYFAAFAAGMTLLHLLLYGVFPGSVFFTRVILFMGVVGAMPALAGLSYTAGLFLSGGALGFLADGLFDRSFAEGASGAGWWMIGLTVAGFLSGMAAEVIVRQRRRADGQDGETPDGRPSSAGDPRS